MPPCTPFVDSAYGRVGVYTSGTRPTGINRWEGQFIYETDTKRVLFYESGGWVIMAEPTQSVTPTLSGLASGTGGTPQNTMTYHRSDGYLDFMWRFKFGTSGQTFPTNPVLNLPVASSEAEMTFPVIFLDSGVARYQGLATTNSVGSVSITTFAASPAAITTTTPFTWGSNDEIIVRGRYQMTTRYS